MSVPNLISLIRLFVLTPLFVVLLIPVHSPSLALIDAIVLGITDWADGQIARRFHQITPVGRKLDPIADRVSQLVVLTSIVATGLLPLWMGIVLSGADTVLGITLLVKGHGETLQVRWIGRARTAILMGSLPLLLLLDALVPHNKTWLVIAVIVVGIGVILHAVADLTYTLTLLNGTAFQQQDATQPNGTDNDAANGNRTMERRGQRPPASKPTLPNPYLSGMAVICFSFPSIPPRLSRRRGGSRTLQ